MATPVEGKVKASTAAAAVSGIALWIIGRYAFKGGAVPDVVASWVYVLVPAVVTFAAGYLAKHTSLQAEVLMPAVMTASTPAPADRPPEKTLAPPAAAGPEGT
jgi:hypothetical protein